MEENIFYKQDLFGLLSKTEAASLDKMRHDSVSIHMLCLIFVPWRHLSATQAEDFLQQINSTQPGRIRVTVTTDCYPRELLPLFSKLGIGHVFASYCRLEEQALFLEKGIDLQPFPLLPDEPSDAWGIQDLWRKVNSEVVHYNCVCPEAFVLPGLSSSLWDPWVKGKDAGSTKRQLQLLYGAESLNYDINLLGMTHDIKGQSDFLFLLMLLQRFKSENSENAMLIDSLTLTINRMKLMNPDLLMSELNKNSILHDFCHENLPNIINQLTDKSAGGVLQ